MFHSDQATADSSDATAAEPLQLGEHDLPAPLDHWSKQDFDDIVPSWTGT